MYTCIYVEASWNRATTQPRLSHEERAEALSGEVFCGRLGKKLTVVAGSIGATVGSPQRCWKLVNPCLEHFPTSWLLASMERFNLDWSMLNQYVKKPPRKLLRDWTLYLLISCRTAIEICRCCLWTNPLTHRKIWMWKHVGHKYKHISGLLHWTSLV